MFLLPFLRSFCCVAGAHGGVYFGVSVGGACPVVST